jgi:hypothetical protein
LDGISARSPEPLRKVFQVVLSIAFGVGKHRQKSRTCFPGDFILVVEMAHRIAASFVLPQDLSYELTFGEITMIQFYLFVGDIDLFSQKQNKSKKKSDRESRHFRHFCP